MGVKEITLDSLPTQWNSVLLAEYPLWHEGLLYETIVELHLAELLRIGKIDKYQWHPKNSDEDLFGYDFTVLQSTMIRHIQVTSTEDLAKKHERRWQDCSDSEKPIIIFLRDQEKFKTSPEVFSELLAAFE